MRNRSNEKNAAKYLNDEDDDDDDDDDGEDPFTHEPKGDGQ